jgi:uncharacterized membrane protein YsdA (DUF1294 family)
MAGRITVGLCALALAVVATAAGVMPWPLLAAYLGLSTVSFLMYWRDKAAAQAGGRRTPESTLHLADLLGGWPGALIAQQQFRHKTAKTSFQVVFWITVAANVAACMWLVRSGMANRLAQSIGGFGP